MSATPLVERAHGPASRQTRALEATLRRSWLPLARAWRLTPRGIRLLQRMTDPTGRVPVVRGTRVEPTRAGDRPAEWVRAPRALTQAADQLAPAGTVARPAGITAPRAAPVVLYLHGGGYVFGSPRTHRTLVSRISQATGLAVLALDYRLPPEAILPAPLHDALAAYRQLLGAGHDARRIVVAGDSAGGNLALALALHAAEAGLPSPAALVLLSPWADLSGSGGSHVTNAALDPFIPPGALPRFARVAAGRDADLADWRLSPLHAPEALWRTLPPALVQAGTTELLRDDAVAVARRIAAAGGRAELDLFDRQPHVVPLWTGTPEARAALREIGRFASSVLDGASAPAPPSEADLAAAAEVAQPADPA